MNAGTSEQKSPVSSGLTPYLSPLAVWALSFGCSVGWGAFVMPGTTFLPIAGPLGTVIGIALGAIAMLIIGVNYHYMISRHPDAGGAFSYTKHAFGHDHGFLVSWFLALTYISIVWANATALSLIAKYLFGTTFQFGFHYQIAGYEIYFGEALLAIGVIALGALICAFYKRLAGWLQILFALLLFGGIAFCAVAVLGSLKGGLSSLAPAFSSDRGNAFQIFGIMALTPWAFVGFESISHSAPEFKASRKKRYLLPMLLALIAGALSYILLSLIGAAALPEGYADWTQYLADLKNLDGIPGLPTFFAAEGALGTNGIVILGIAVLGGILTGVIGNLIASSRLLYAMSEEGLIPAWFGKIGKGGTPKNALWFLALLSVGIPFLGRTAIGWIVDVTTIGATVAFGYTSASALKTARAEKRRGVAWTGAIGLILSIVFSLYLLIPNLWSSSSLATESYLILAAWAILGTALFRLVLNKDKARRFGKSTVVWIALVFLIFFTSLMWMRQSSHQTTTQLVTNLSEHYEEDFREHGVSRDEIDLSETEDYLTKQLDLASDSLQTNSLIQLGLILIALVIFFNMHNLMKTREQETELERMKAEHESRAKSSFLSNMSHDIRTPMNAIIGYTALAKREEELSPKLADYLDKIDSSSKHLLGLINDILDLSRIESGKMELSPEPGDLVSLMDEIQTIFDPQMKEKKILYTVDASGVRDPYAVFDRNRLERVLLNLVSNAYKFTPSGKSVCVTLTQTNDAERSYLLSVKDTGIGMSKEFAAHVFEAYERERSKTVEGIQGTGLGMAITKSLVDLMHGTIEVQTEQGKGTEFLIRLDFEPARKEDLPAPVQDEKLLARDFTGKTLLLVDDNEINRSLATLILKKAGFTVESAADGKEAVERVRESDPRRFDAILMDVQMPVMNGYEATRAIRALPDKERAALPIIAMTANAFKEDQDEAKAAGMDAYVTKPIEIGKLLQTLEDLLD